MKKFLAFIIAALISAACITGIAGCNPDLREKYKNEIDKEMRACFDFFWDNTPTSEADEARHTYGLCQDRWPDNSKVASIASVGFGLTVYVIGAEEGYVERQAAEERSLKTLQSVRALQQNSDTAYEGCLAHFINPQTGKNSNSEISTIDTAIFICGALTAGEYFGGQTEQLANEIYSAVNWKYFQNIKGGKTYISMGCNSSGTLLSNWNWYAEQLMIYVLGAGSPNAEYRLDDKAYYAFERPEGRYGDSGVFIYSWYGSIFTYQFSHAWINFSGLVDKNGTDWYQNSVNASKAAYNYCNDNKNLSATFKDGGWGLTACDTASGYSGYLGNPPRGWTANSDYSKIEGTVAPCGAIGSVVFTPEESLKALKLYQGKRFLNGLYGLTDAYNLDQDFYANSYIGIDKGVSIIMLANYKNDCVWNVTMQNEYILSGLKNLGFTAA